MRRKLEAEVPMGRIGSVEDIASIVALLVSPRGRYITGTAIQVDGGLLRARCERHEREDAMRFTTVVKPEPARRWRKAGSGATRRSSKS